MDQVVMAPLHEVGTAHAWLVEHWANLVRAGLIPLFAWVIVWLLVRFVQRFQVEREDTGAVGHERAQRTRTLALISAQIIRVTVWSIAGVEVLAEVGVDVKPIIAGAGIIGLAVGFGAQTLVKDLIAGFFMLLEDQVRVGDVITAADVSGVVEAINLRTLVLRDFRGAVHVIPNGAISTVTNMTREWARAVLDVGVPYEQDVERCIDVLKQVGAGISSDAAWAPRLRGPFEFPGVERFDDSQVVLRMQVQTRASEQWAVLRELRRRVKAAFDEHGIEMPYPQRKITIAGEVPR